MLKSGIASELLKRVVDYRRFLQSSSHTTERHQKWLMGLPANVIPPHGDLPTIIAVGGGKGGIGKSILSANLGAKLAEAGLSVLLVDLDIGCANLHTHFGLTYPERTLGDFLVHGRRTFREIVLPTGIPGLRLVAGGRDEAWDTRLDAEGRVPGELWSTLLNARADMGIDFVILDLGAGTYRHTMNFFSMSHVGIIMVLPEPTSIENAYVFIKAALHSYITNLCRRLDVPHVGEDIEARLGSFGQGTAASGYVARLQGLASRYPEIVRNIFHVLNGRTMGLVINQARSYQDIEIGKSMELICQRYFGFRTSYLGYLNYDDAAWKALRNRRLLAMDFPHSGLTKRIGMVAEQILANVIR